MGGEPVPNFLASCNIAQLFMAVHCSKKLKIIIFY